MFVKDQTNTLRRRTASLETWRTIEDVLGVCGHSVRQGGKITADCIRLVIVFFIAITLFSTLSTVPQINARRFGRPYY